MLLTSDYFPFTLCETRDNTVYLKAWPLCHSELTLKTEECCVQRRPAKFASGGNGKVSLMDRWWQMTTEETASGNIWEAWQNQMQRKKTAKSSVIKGVCFKHWMQPNASGCTRMSRKRDYHPSLEGSHPDLRLAPSQSLQKTDQPQGFKLQFLNREIQLGFPLSNRLVEKARQHKILFSGI